MSWWIEHQHVWRTLSQVSVQKRENEPASKIIFVQDCSCGRVRTIEVISGKEPVIRIAIAAAEEP